MLSPRAILAITFVWLFSLPVISCTAQQNKGKPFDLPAIVDQVNGSRSAEMTVFPWWNEHVTSQQKQDRQGVKVDIESLLLLAIHNSNAIEIASAEPKIRHARVEELDAGFDWNHFTDANWNDSSEPTGSSLTAGDGISRFNDHQLSGESGLRRSTRTGGQLSLGQRFGWQNNNSNFLTPPNQANSRLTLSYTHPLLRGRGKAYTTSVVVLAQVDALIADEQFRADLESHLLEIVRAYWSLFRERASLAQQVHLLLKTKEIVDVLAARQRFDTQRTQYVSALAALEARKSTLLETRLRVASEEARLRGLINAEELGQPAESELVPIGVPSSQTFRIDTTQQLETALVNRPEALMARQQVRQAMTRLGLAQHEIMPQLNLVTQGYLSGLQGDADFAKSFTDQFSTGAPSYSVGLNYELALGNRAAKSRLSQRQIELDRLQREFQQTLQMIRTDVELAIQQIRTARGEIVAKSRALKAADAELETLRLRWDGMLDRGQNSGLNLESLLRAQERLTDFEQQYMTALLNYNLAEVELKKANGTLLQSESLGESRVGQQVVDGVTSPSQELQSTGNQYAVNKSDVTTQASNRARSLLDPLNTKSQSTTTSPVYQPRNADLYDPKTPRVEQKQPVYYAPQRPREQSPQLHAPQYRSPPPPESKYTPLPDNFRIEVRNQPREKFSFPNSRQGRQQTEVHAKPFNIIPERPLSTAGFGNPFRTRR